MDFVTAIKTCITKYADFTGRATRSEYWWLALAIFLGGLICVAIAHWLVVVFDLLIILPNLAVSARRLHDIDRSAWWLLIMFVPVVGTIVLIVWFCQKSDPFDNRFGPAPLPNHALRAQT